MPLKSVVWSGHYRSRGDLAGPLDPTGLIRVPEAPLRLCWSGCCRAKVDGRTSDSFRLLADVDRGARLPGHAHQEFVLAHVSAYVVAAKMLTKLGAADLAMLASDRAARAAVDSGSDVALGTAAYQVTGALLRADRSDDAEHLTVGMAEQVQERSEVGCAKRGFGRGSAVADRRDCRGPTSGPLRSVVVTGSGRRARRSLESPHKELRFAECSIV